MRRLNVGLPGSNVTRDGVISTIKEAKMGRIVASVIIENLTDQDARIRCDALVDTGASYMVLPDAWRDRLGELDEITTVPLETARQETVEGKICGPV
jgi:predicted aspartyl protease